MLALVALAACSATSTLESISRHGVAADGQADGPPRIALARFVTAIDAQRWADAYALLSARWRARLTPARLASDYANSGSMGRVAADRVRALLTGGAPLTVREGTALLEIGEGRSAVLVREGDTWRVDALE
jgi:hypothetical protein